MFLYIHFCVCAYRQGAYAHSTELYCLNRFCMFCVLFSFWKIKHTNDTDHIRWTKYVLCVHRNTNGRIPHYVCTAYVHAGRHTHTHTHHRYPQKRRRRRKKVVTKIECSVQNMRSMKGKNFNLRMNMVSIKANNGKNREEKNLRIGIKHYRTT